MKLEAILHIPLSQYAYALDERTLTIRLRTAKGDAEECTVFYGDRVEPKPEITVFSVKMELVSTDDLFDYFEAKIRDDYSRICYYFQIKDKTECIYYYERGFCRKMSCCRTEFFQFPYIRREEIQKIPAWAKDIVMYHIFPDSFATGRRKLEEKGKKIHVKEEIYSESKLGGTLRGICENIDYLKDLGINCIYLNPIFLANSYHKYDTIDYYSVDPCFGEIADVKALVQKCHKNGIRVIFDGVFNHSGPDFAPFRDVLQKGKASQYFPYFYELPEKILYQDPPNYETFAYVKEMPKLNTSNEKLQEYLIEAGKFWVRETDIDGWRLDVANEIDHAFWRRFKKEVKEVKADLFFIGEIWEDAQTWLSWDQFDSTMNYRFSYLCKDFFAKRTMSVSEFDAQIHRMLMRYPTPVSLVQMNFLDSHDIPRFLSECEGDRRRMELAYFYLFMTVGIPSVFYGDECYIEGREEKEYRRGMLWDTKENCIEKMQQWIAMRRCHSALRNGSYKTVECDDRQGIYSFLRKNEKEELLITINNSKEDRMVRNKKICAFSGDVEVLFPNR